MATQFLQNFSVEPLISIVLSWTLLDHREADQRNFDAQDLRRLPDGFLVPRLRTGRPMDQNNPPSISHIRYEGQPLAEFIPSVNQLQ